MRGSKQGESNDKEIYHGYKKIWQIFCGICESAVEIRGGRFLLKLALVDIGATLFYVDIYICVWVGLSGFGSVFSSIHIYRTVCVGFF